MKKYYPSFYDKFSCLCDACPDTCCAKWEIVVDEESLIKYNSIDGEFGEKLMTDEDKKREKETGCSPMYLPSHLPEYKEICELHSEEERKLNAYREQCKNEALELFSKWFYSLGF